MLKCPVSFGFIRIALPVIPPIVGVVLQPFLMTQPLLGPVIRIGFHFVALPGRPPGTLAGSCAAVVLPSIARSEKPAAVNAGALIHIAAPVSSLN